MSEPIVYDNMPGHDQLSPFARNTLIENIGNTIEEKDKQIYALQARLDKAKEFIEKVAQKRDLAMWISGDGAYFPCNLPTEATALLKELEDK